MRLLMLLTVLVFCTSLANGMWKGKKYGVYKYKTFYLPENFHAACSEENAKDVKLVHKNLWKSQRLICSQSGGDKMGSEMMRDKEVCICFQDSDSTWVKRCGNCYVPVKINYKPEGYEPAIYSETESNSRSAAALEDKENKVIEVTTKAIAETADLNPTPIQESEASNAPSGEVSNDDLEIPNKTKMANKAKIKAPKKKATAKKPSTKGLKKKAAAKKPSIKAHNKRKAKKKFRLDVSKDEHKKKKPGHQSKNKRRFRNRKTEDISNDLPNRPDVGVTQDSWNDIPNNFQVEDESVDNEDLFAADELLDLYATE